MNTTGASFRSFFHNEEENRCYIEVDAAAIFLKGQSKRKQYVYISNVFSFGHNEDLFCYMYLMSVDIFLLWLKTRLLKSCLEISKQRVLTPPTKVKHVVKGKISQRKTNVAKCPIQLGITKCGYYVLKFMKAIVDEGLEVLTNNFWEKVTYTDAELDMVREE
ncbi:hypothetical protein LXL04_035784 [Taraxacum kok-saghyz]